MKDETSETEHETLRSALAHERELTAKLTRELNQERRRNDLIEADQADLIEKVREIRRLQVLAEELLSENKRYRDLVTRALEGGGPQKKTDVPEALDAYFTELAQARREIASLRQQHAEDCQRYEADEGELRQRLEALKSELLRVQKVNEQAYVLRSVYDPMFERLTDLEREVAELRTHRMEAIPLLQERDAIVNSTTWKLTSAPRAFLTLLRRGKHG